MKAIVFTQYGSPDGLEIRDVPTPTPQDDEVQVCVHASSVNSWDWEYLNGVPFVNRLMFGLFKPKPGKQRLGADIAGTVESVGARVTRFQPGDEVFGDLWDHWGGFAEYACTKETALEFKPANLTFEQAAAIPQAGVLALQALRKAGSLREGQKVLINGAGGGVGTFAIQLARLAGAEVTGVDAAHKLKAAAAVGAEHIIDYEKTDYTRTGQQYDLIIDCHAFRSMFAYRRALAPGGTFAMVGGSMRRILEMMLLNWLPPFTRDGKRLRLVAEGPNQGLDELKRLVEAGELAPVIDRTFSLDEAPEALRYFGQQQHAGKIAISVH